MQNKRINMTVGEAVIRFLDNQYVSFDGKETKFVEGINTIFGHGCVLGIGEALAMSEHSLKVYQGKNEQGMAHTAIAYAKQNNRRKIIPCVSSIGPGSANMVTAAATATVNNIPLLLFLGDTFASRRPDPVLQQVEQNYNLLISTNDAFKPVVKYFDRVYRPDMLESALLAAMRTLISPVDTGAVALAMPQDVQGEVYDFPEALFNKKVWKIPRTPAEECDVIEAARIIRESKKPLIIVGGGVRYSEAGDCVSEFSKWYNIPIAETQAGKSSVKSSHSLNLGGIGVTGNFAANNIAIESDLIIAVGTRFSDFTTSSKSLFRNARIITINTSDFHASKLNAFKLVGDAKTILTALSSHLDGYRSEYKEEIRLARQLWEDEYQRLVTVDASKAFEPEVKCLKEGTIEEFKKASGSKLSQTKAIGIIRDIIPKNSIVVGASGSLPGCLQRMWKTDEKDSYNMEYGYSCMGYEIAGALGSKLAEPQKEVFAMTGDGSYLMLHGELVTAVQEGKKITVLLFDNGGFGCINNLQMGKGIKSLATEMRFNSDSNAPFVPIDFAKSAEGYGVKTFTARDEKELKDALKKGLLEEKSVLIDIKVLPKTMTDGYEGGWWQTGLSHNPRNERQKEALLELQNVLKED